MKVYSDAGVARFKCDHVEHVFVWVPGSLHIDHPLHDGIPPACPEPGCEGTQLEGDDPFTADTREIADE